MSSALVTVSFSDTRGHIPEASGHRDLGLHRDRCGHLATEAWRGAEPSQGKEDWGLENPDLQDGQRMGASETNGEGAVSEQGASQSMGV